MLLSRQNDVLLLVTFMVLPYMHSVMALRLEAFCFGLLYLYPRLAFSFEIHVPEMFHVLQCYD